MLARIIPVDGPDGRPDNSLPPELGGRPDNSLPPLPGAPDNSLPAGPPGVWPPMNPGRPVHPIAPGGPDVPPGTIWPTPGQPDNGLPSPPGTPDNSLPSGKFWVVAGIPGIGWRYVCVDPSLKPDQGLPGGKPPKPDNSLPGSQPGVDNTLPGSSGTPSQPIAPGAQPKR